jgi:hypothetical protein
VVEHWNRIIVVAARSMLKAKGLPSRFWGDAVSTIVHILNRCPSKSVDGMTPFEAWHEKKPVVHHIKTFDCIVYVRNTTPHLKKLEGRGCKMILVSNQGGTKAYRAYDPAIKCVHVTRDVFFDEEAQWGWGTDVDIETTGDNNDMFTMEYTIENQAPLLVVGDAEAPRDVSSTGDMTLPPSPHATVGDTFGVGGTQTVVFASLPVQVARLDSVRLFIALAIYEG